MTRKKGGDHGIYLTSNDSDCNNSAIIRLYVASTGDVEANNFSMTAFLSLSSMISAIISISKERRVNSIIS